MDMEKLSNALKTVAGITLNCDATDHDSLRKAASMLSNLSLDEGHELHTLFSSTLSMTVNFIEKVWTGRENDLDPINDGIILLRAIVRSLATQGNFVFEDKDIQVVIQNLEKIKTSPDSADLPERDSDVICEIITQMYTLALTFEADDIETLSLLTEMLDGIALKEDSTYAVMFSSVKGMAAGYLARLAESSVSDTEPLKEAILLLRAISRSEKNDSDFPFENKDILNVVENLGESVPAFIMGQTPSKANHETLLADCQELSTILNELSHDNIPALGLFLNKIEVFEDALHYEVYSDIHDLVQAMQHYVEKLILEEESNMDVLTESLSIIRAYLNSLIKGESYTFDIDSLVKTLTASVEQEKKTSNESEVIIKPSQIQSIPVKDLIKDDVEVLEDFLIEARDNLEAIEINLVDLEQSPEDNEIINAIFRPFHTIKGVSGFLNLRKINALSHSTETLLDSARDGEFIIDQDITDLVLKSVDVLKQLLNRVENGLELMKTADDDNIEINALIDRIEQTNAFCSSPNNEIKPVGEILVSKGNLREEDLEIALETQNKNPVKKIGEILIETQVVETKDVISALRDQKRGRRQSAPQVKVDTGKLDNLVDLTGELVISQSILKQNSMNGSGADKKILQNLNQLGQIVSNIQKIAMSMRMVPISATFQKMVRLVRDLSKNCNKDVGLEMIGEETEIDRNVVEALYEPMVHMIRNSIDHGLETHDERQKTGKAAKGKITLRAYHKGGNIIIEITDDGKGLNQFNILEKAIQSGIITGEEELNDDEIHQLIMAPGFSTAETITDISGRGVGMDVVKKGIEDLNGRIDIHSEEGKGSTFSICLPLTLAIIEGMLVRIGEEKFIIPTMAILESFRPLQDDYFTVENKGEMLLFRKSLVPLIRLNQICNIEMDNDNVWESIVIVVENKNDQRGILIDELLGKEEFVIKSLGESLTGVKGLAGGAILGNGRVGLIIDINGIFNVADTM